MKFPENAIINKTTLDKIELPSTLYKYRSWNKEYDRRFILEREVYFASADTFEDDLDCQNPARFDLLTDRQVYNFYFEDSKKRNLQFSRQQHRKFARDHFKTSDARDQKKTIEWQNWSLDQYNKHEGILSLTENPKNKEMWLKYGNSDQGFCIGYEPSILFQFLGGGGKVDYVDELPIILPMPYTSFWEASQLRTYSKLVKWSFEEEYRCKKSWEHPPSISDRQVQLPEEAFKHVILGSKISNQDEEEIRAEAVKNIGKIEIIKHNYS